MLKNKHIFPCIFAPFIKSLHIFLIFQAKYKEMKDDLTLFHSIVNLLLLEFDSLKSSQWDDLWAEYIKHSHSTGRVVPTGQD